MKLDGGFEVALGLNLPDETELALIAQSLEYPESRMLDDKDIQRALKDDFYQQERKRVAPWMINQNSLGKCCPSALIGAMDQIRDNQGLPHEPLADNDAYMQINGGGDQGAALIRAFQLAQTRGIAPRSASRFTDFCEFRA